MKPEYLSHCCGAKIYADDICSECREFCDPEYDQYPDPDTDPEAQDIKRMVKNYPDLDKDNDEWRKLNH